MVEAGAEPEPGEPLAGEQLDVAALLGRRRQVVAGGQQQLAARQPRGRVGVLGDVDPADRAVGRALARGELEPAVRRAVSRRSAWLRAARSDQPRALQLLPGLRQHRPQHVVDLVELLGVADQRRRELDHGVAAIVGAADQPAAVELAGEEAAQQPLGLLVGEARLGLLVA